MVGDVIGKYHPHGDQCVYDAMVRLAQDFALRYPLVDGQGNFGNIDGDNAAAYRYTEARLTAVAMQLMAGLDEGTVDFKPTYNGEEEEPEVFPGLFPNLLANGASGIAVGMATSIPPHNVAELIDAAVAADRQSQGRRPRADGMGRRARTSRPAACWSTAARRDRAAYATGRGASACAPRSRGRAREGRRLAPAGQRNPYGVPKAKLIEQIAQLIADKKLPILADVRDESDEQVRLVLEPRAAPSIPMLLESLYRLTDLEVRFPLNLNVLDATRTPGVMSLKEALLALARVPDRRPAQPLAAATGSARSTTGSSCSTASSSPSSTSTG